MSDELGPEEAAAPEEEAPQQTINLATPYSTGVGFLMFVLGLVLGFPIAIVGAGYFAAHADLIAGLVFGALLVIAGISALIVVYRKRIWGFLFRISEVQLEQFAGPLAEAARHVADKQPEEAAEAARRFAQMALARWAWISTRRWIIGSITGLVAATAALAGSALLFRQNELIGQQTVRLDEQNSLIGDQSKRLEEQTRLLDVQIELAEASRSASILSEISRIADGIEAAAKADDASGETITDARDLPASLRSRVIVATLAARPYRYLERKKEASQTTALRRRNDLASVVNNLPEKPADGGASLVDRPQSPERGLVLMMLYHAGIRDLVGLHFNGADFSGAVLNNKTFVLLNTDHGLLEAADFERSFIAEGRFRGAQLALARFNSATIRRSDFSAIGGDEDAPEYKGSGASYPTQLPGADFFEAAIQDTRFAGVQGLAVRFDRTFLQNVSFADASLPAATFREAFLVDVDFSGADLRSVDFDGALTLSQSILDDVAGAAQPGTFIADRYRVEEADFALLEDRPAHHWPADAVIAQAKSQGRTLYKIVRVKPFE